MGCESVRNLSEIRSFGLSCGEDCVKRPAKLQDVGTDNESTVTTATAYNRVNDVWQRYKAAGDLQLRNELVLHYTGLVRYVASKVAAGLPAQIDRDDLTSYGVFGLIDAIHKFDLDKGVKFETYAITRIKGAIIDELRGQDRVPRSVRSKVRTLDRATSELEAELGRAPGDIEIAQRLDVTVDELWVMQREATVTSVVALDEHASDGRQSLYDTLRDVASNPEDLFTSGGEVVDLLADAVATMTGRSRIILALYYIEEMTLAGIGEVLGVTESRVCQLQGQLLDTLRTALAEGGARAA